MKRLLVGLSILIFVLSFSGIASALSFNITNGTVSNGGVSVAGKGLTSTYAGQSGFTVVDFDSNSWSVTGQNAVIVNTSLSGKYALPANDTSYYLSVPKNLETTPTSFTTTLSNTETYNYLGLYWGSIDWNQDGYNKIELYDGSEKVATLTGQDLYNNLISGYSAVSSGDQSSSYTNQYINIVTDQAFNAIVISASQYAFETDNFVYGNVSVPEPTTLLLLGFGCFGLAGLKRKFQR